VARVRVIGRRNLIGKNKAIEFCFFGLLCRFEAVLAEGVLTLVGANIGHHLCALAV